MDLINKDFCQLFPDNFGTENVSLFLYSLIKCCRPQNLLEIGAGYSTFFIAESLKDIMNEIHTKEILSRVNGKILKGLNLDFYKQKYNPCLEVIENEEESNTSLNIIKKNLEKLDLFRFVKIYNQNIYNFTPNKEYDFIWVDFGQGDNYLHFFEKYLNFLSKNGIIVVHSTLTNLWGRLFETEIKLRISKGIYSNLELISFLEPHKPIQNSFTIIKKTDNYPIYNMSA